MTTRADYTDEEWAALGRAPLVAAMAVSLADLGGPIEMTRETIAALAAVGAPPGDEPLLAAVSLGGPERADDRRDAIRQLHLTGATAREQIVEELHRVAEILAAKATPGEAAAFRAWMVQAAEDAAAAAREGGLLGIGATRISDGEAEMLGRLRRILGVAPD